MIKFAREIKEGDALEHAQGVFTVLRVVVNGGSVSIRGIVKGLKISSWASYSEWDEFNVVTVH